MTSEYEDIRKTSINLDFKSENPNNNNTNNASNNINNINNNNGIIIFNNPNNNNNKNNFGGTSHKANNNFNFLKYDQSMLRKRTRLSSFEGFWNNIDFENLGYNHKKSIDEVEFLNSFGKEIKYDFHDEELEVFRDECLKNTANAAAGFTFGVETRSSNRKKSLKHKLSVSCF